MKSTRAARWATIATATALSLIAFDATAQQAYSSDATFQVEHFEPLPAQTQNVLNVASSGTLSHMVVSAGLTMHFSDDTLQVQTNDEITNKLIDDNLRAELAAALGLWDRFELGFVLPLSLVQTSDGFGDFPDTSGRAIGDLRVVPRAHIYRIGGLGIGFLAPLYVPTGSRESFAGEGSFRAEPRIALDWTSGRLRILGNAGYQFRPRRVAITYVSDDMFRWAVAGEVSVLDNLDAVASLFGHIVTTEGRDPAEPLTPGPNASGQPMEGQLAARFRASEQFLLTAGAGAGLSGDVGAPDFRVIAGVEWLPKFSQDSDGDGIKNADDACPNEAEDMDGFEDGDGCIDYDNDQDFVSDDRDKCPDALEDKDGFEDDDGCPDPDNDGDGLLDDEDTCMSQAGPAELGGCPAQDSDGDGAFDHVEACPNVPEDFDGFRDDDGCPDLDNDFDGILDDVDQCVAVPEDYNDSDDSDGCPDSGGSKIVLAETGITFVEPLRFSGTRLRSSDKRALDHAASALVNHGDYTGAIVHVSAADGETASARAEAARQYLLDKGLSGGRIRAQGKAGESETAHIVLERMVPGGVADDAEDETSSEPAAEDGGGFNFDEEDVTE